MSNKEVRFTALKWLGILLLSSCQQSTNPRGLVESYLNAITTGDANTAQSLYCVPSDFKNTPLYTATSWEIVSEQETQSEGIPYTKFAAQVVSPTVGGDVAKEWSLWVLKPEDDYRHAEIVNQKIAELGGRPPALNQDNWSNKPLCVFVPDPQ